MEQVADFIETGTIILIDSRCIEDKIPYPRQVHIQGKGIDCPHAATVLRYNGEIGWFNPYLKMGEVLGFGLKGP